ncbi:2-oxoglutarate dehydrogenase E2 component (dihydrolipoamide succinyltransferase) [Streptosporangium canum]|uniref:Dihydrolipoamide acetyltransferase component of pyruvate dehydrogenase complex n=1 Tax=Streptosporangium canum TaxID=324952 RepID=A0A1I3ZLA7_9ACTN|nr:2-oxo acid dehydrogenase subunit E2 [Streptosporangium canum]SFK44878.1 2-oxoglutarate dehydrogenase E2 component (dihydrolipoamide succinyltransferase) [Streptosporangium canum]
MTEIRVPKLNNNDTVYLLVEWAAKDGQTVRAGEPLVVLETSKAAEELVAEEDGTLLCLLEAGAECAPGQVIARLLADGEAPPSSAAEHGASPATPDHEVVVTAPALRLMDERGISMEQVRALGRKVVRRADLESLLAPWAGPGNPVSVTLPTIAPGRACGPAASRTIPEGSGLIEPSRAQRRVAEVVEESHRDIPSAFTVMRVDVTDALGFARQETRRLRVLIGLPELLVRATGRLLDRFPLCFATPVDGRRARRAVSAEVGVTVDVGGGMVVPVVRDAGRRPLGEIADDLTRFRRAALDGTFREQDLQGGNIMLTLHTDAAVVMAVPVVFPGQTCALSLAAPRPEVVETRDGGFAVRKVIMLGLAYDHRFVNGRDSAEFLGALRTALESPGDGACER